MNQLITIQQQTINNQNTNAVSARELHKSLELKTQFTDWVNQFLDDFIQGTDFINISGKTVEVQSDGHQVLRSLTDYYFTIDMAKQIAMLTRTSKGKEIRLYFIECEKQLQQHIQIPQTYAAALLEAGRLALELESQTKRIEKLIHSGNSYTTSQIAKETGFKSAYELNQLLANQGLIYKQRGVWLLIAKYSSKGYQEIKQTELENGKIIYNATWTDSGREFILNFVERI